MIWVPSPMGHIENIFADKVVAKLEVLGLQYIKAGNTYATHSFKMPKENDPVCKFCQFMLTVQHIFECRDNNTVRKIRNFIYLMKVSCLSGFSILKDLLYIILSTYSAIR